MLLCCNISYFFTFVRFYFVKMHFNPVIFFWWGCTIGQVFWLYICPTDNGKNKTHSQLNGAPTVCWTCRFFCLPTIPPTNRSSLLPWFESWQTNTCASVFTVVCPRLYCTQRSGEVDITQCTVFPCVPNQELRKNPHIFTKKKKNNSTEIETRVVASPTRGEQKSLTVVKHQTVKFCSLTVFLSACDYVSCTRLSGWQRERRSSGMRRTAGDRCASLQPPPNLLPACICAWGREMRVESKKREAENK